MSVMEISHRSQHSKRSSRGRGGPPPAGRRSPPTTDTVPAGRRESAVLDGADEPADGGATADYIMTGDWARKALKEAKRVGDVQVAASTEGGEFNRIPTDAELEFTPGAAYVHMTSNNTIEGTEWHAAAGRRRRAARQRRLERTSSAARSTFEVRADLRRRPEEPRAVRRDGRHRPRGSAGAIERSRCQTMLNYAVQAENGSLYNTPPAFGDVRPRPGDASGCSDRAACRRSPRSTSARPESCTTSSTGPGSGEPTAEADSRSS